MENRDMEMLDKWMVEQGDEKGIDGIKRYFDVEINKSNLNNLYELSLVARDPSRLSTKISFNRHEDDTADMSYERFKIPDAEKLDATSIKTADSILKAAGHLWLLDPFNNILIRLDTTQGYAGLDMDALFPSYSLPEGEKNTFDVQLRRYQQYVVIYFLSKDSWTDPFCLWINMDTKKVVGANWYEIWMGSGGLISTDEIERINKALREHGDFGVYGNVTSGLEKLIQYDEINMRYSDESNEWNIDITPLDGHGHFLGFTVNMKTGEVGQPIAGHLEPEPDDLIEPRE